MKQVHCRSGRVSHNMCSCHKILYNRDCLPKHDSLVDGLMPDSGTGRARSRSRRLSYLSERLLKNWGYKR